MIARYVALVLVLAAGVRPAVGEQEGQEAKVARPSPAAVAQWRKQLQGWGKEFFGGEGKNRQAQWQAGREKIAAIDDPAAIPAIVALLKTEKHPQFRRALIQPLIKLGGKEAVDCLVKWSVEDDNPLLREEAAKGLIGKEGLEAHLDTYIAYLKSPIYVSNAAEALSWTRLCQPLSTVDQPNEKLVKALVNALHTVTREIVPYSVRFDTGWQWRPSHTGNAASRTWGTDKGMVQVKIPKPVPSVLNALRDYSGQDYQYDESQWNKWLVERSGD
jgi:hypothetical protein